MRDSKSSGKKPIKEVQELRARKPKLERASSGITGRKKAEKELRQSEEFLANMIDALDDPVFVKDEQHRWVILNDAACKVMGRSREELIGKSDYDLFSKQQADVFWERDDSVLKSGRTDINEEEITWHGKLHTISIKKSLFTDSVTGKKFIVGTIRDITELKKTEEALRESEERFRLAVQAAQLSTWNWDLLTDEVWLGGHSSEVLGLAPDSKSISVSYFMMELLNPEDLERIRQAVDQAINERTLYNEEYRIVRPDGTERWIAAQGQPVYDKTGKAVRMIGANQDITERKKAEEAMKESEKRLKEAQRIGMIGNWEFDVATQEITWSEQVYDLFERAPDRGPPTYEENMSYYYPEDSAKLQDQVRRAIEFGDEFDSDYHVKLPSGKSFYHRGLIRTLRDDNGRPIKLYGTVQDITERKQAQEKIKLFSHAIAGAIDAIGITDMKGIFTYANPAMEEIFGYKKGELIGKHVSTLNLKPETAEEIVSTLIKTGSWNGEVLQQKKNKETFPALLSLSTVRDEKGDPIAMMGAIRDITERKQAQQLLEESESRFRELVENIHEVFWMENSNGTELLYVSPTYEQVWGRSCASFYENPKVWIEAIHPDDRQRVAEAFSRFRETGVYSEEFRIVRPDGTIRWIWDRGVLIHNESGEFARVAGIAEDITQRKQAEDALKESERRFRSLSEAAFEGIGFAEKGVLLDANEAFTNIFGYSLEELKGKQVIELVAPEHRELVAENIRSGYEGIYEHKGLHKDGSLIDLEVHGRSVTYQGREMRLTAIRDITERKQADQKLLEDQVKLKSLASELSLAEERERHRIATELHDRIGQSLVISKMNLEALRKSEYGKKTDEILDEICNSLAQTIADTRTLTFDLSSPILYELGFETAVAEWLTEQIQDEYGIATQFEDDGRPKLLGDDIGVLLFRNVRELLINVVKHAHAHKVKVAIRKVGKKIQVSVEDDGVGFDPAEAASSAAKRAEFGLFSIRQRLEQLGGHLEIKSEPGRGCKVTMTAPLKQNID